MPRNPQITLRRRVEAAWRNHQQSLKIVEKTRTALDAACVAAVEGGMTKYEVGQIRGKVSSSYIGKLPGMKPNRTIGAKK